MRFFHVDGPPEAERVEDIVDRRSSIVLVLVIVVTIAIIIIVARFSPARRRKCFFPLRGQGKTSRRRDPAAEFQRRQQVADSKKKIRKGDDWKKTSKSEKETFFFFSGNLEPGHEVLINVLPTAMFLINFFFNLWIILGKPDLSTHAPGVFREHVLEPMEVAVGDPNLLAQQTPKLVGIRDAVIQEIREARRQGATLGNPQPIVHGRRGTEKKFQRIQNFFDPILFSGGEKNSRNFYRNSCCMSSSCWRA